MAVPTITLTAAKKSAEVIRAIGQIVNAENENGDTVPPDGRANATAAQVDLWLVQKLKAAVLRSELLSISDVAETDKRTALQGKGW
jgi:hypothetical protein